MKFRALSLGIISVLGVASMNVAAIVDLSNTVAPGDPVYYPTEANIEGGALLVNGALGGDAKFTSNYSVQQGNKVYARLELTGATVKTLGWTSAVIASSNAGVVPTLVEGGIVDTNYGIFELNAATASMAASDVFTLSFGAGGSQMGLTSAAGVQARVRLYNTLTGAQVPDHPTSVAVKDYSGTIIGFKSAINWKVAPNSSPTVASVDSLFVNFKATTSPLTSATLTDLSNTTLQAATGVMDITTGTPITLAHLITSASTFTLEGDFSAATKIEFQPAGASCAGAAIMAGAIATDGTSATFTLGTGVAGFADADLCFTANGTTSMDASSYLLTFNPIAAAPTTYDVSKIVIAGEDAGSIVRDGATLRTGFASKYNMQVSKFIFANAGSSDATITQVKLYDNASGPFTTTILLPLPKTLPAGARTEIKMEELVDIASMPKQNFMVEFSVGSTNDKVFGTYQLLLNGSDVQTLVPMERLTSAYGH